MEKRNDEYLATWRIESFSKTMDFSLAAQKSIFVLNGTAAITVLAFLGNCIGKEEYHWGAIPLLAYVIGIMFNVEGLFLTREAQIAYTILHNKAGDYLNSVITVTCIISLVLFMGASIYVAQKSFDITGIWSRIMLWVIPFIILIVLVATYFLILNTAKKLGK